MYVGDCWYVLLWKGASAMSFAVAHGLAPGTRLEGFGLLYKFPNRCEVASCRP